MVQFTGRRGGAGNQRLTVWLSQSQGLVQVDKAMSRDVAGVKLVGGTKDGETGLCKDMLFSD